jgi:SNF2 family DNA or RNA helicase
VIPDPRRLPPEVRQQIAQRARAAPDAREFTSQAVYFNTRPCRRHGVLEHGCQDCGISLRRHQRTGAAWLWFVMHGMLADSCGLGKTAQVGAVLAMALQTGELGAHNRAVIVVQAAAIRQWARELRRMVPALVVITADGTPEERMRAYLGAWDTCIVSDRTLSPAGRPGGRGYRDGDVERLRQFPVGIVVYDDIDAMRNGTTKTAWAVKRLSATADRVYGLHATPLQKRLVELYHALEPVGSREILGPLHRVRQRYVTQKSIYVWVPDRTDPTGRRKKRKKIIKDSGARADNLPEFKRLVAPMILRRTVRDLDDVELPAVQSSEVWLDLLPQQRQRYDDLATGLLTRLRDTGTEITHVQAAAAYTRARQICSGLAALDDGRDVSVKLDWCMDRITGDLSEDKVFCFVYFRENVQALSDRLTGEGIGHVLLWSRETDPAERDRRMQRFASDPECRVVVATTTAERSLNLQAASHLIAVDTILNPARMTQILGRVRRQGSRHSMVLFHHLLTRGTLEEDYPAMLRQEQALADAVWEDTGELFTADMTPRQIMQMVARRAALQQWILSGAVVPYFGHGRHCHGKRCAAPPATERGPEAKD